MGTSNNSLFLGFQVFTLLPNMLINLVGIVFFHGFNSFKFDFDSWSWITLATNPHYIISPKKIKNHSSGLGLCTHSKIDNERPINNLYVTLNYVNSSKCLWITYSVNVEFRLYQSPILQRILKCENTRYGSTLIIR